MEMENEMQNEMEQFAPWCWIWYAWADANEKLSSVVCVHILNVINEKIYFNLLLGRSLTGSHERYVYTNWQFQVI